MKLRILSGWVAWGVGFVTVACGGHSSGGGAPSGFSSTVPGDTVLGMLSDADEAKLCTEVNGYVATVSAQVNDTGCKVAGIVAALGSGASTDAEAQTACKNAYSQCQADPANHPDPTGTSGTSGMSMCDGKPSSACMATVSELSSCLNDELAIALKFEQGLTPCDQLTLKNELNGISTAPPTTPPSCTTLQSKCPEADFSGMMGASGT